MNQCYEVFHLTLCILCTPCKHLLSMKNCCLVAWNFSICGIIWKHFQNMSSKLLFSTGLNREFILSIDVPLVFWIHINYEVKRGHCIERTWEGQRRKKEFFVTSLFPTLIFSSLQHKMEFMEFFRRMGSLSVFPLFVAYMAMVGVVPRIWKRYTRPMELRLVRSFVVKK